MVMGYFNTKPLQALYSGIKVPMLLGISTLICLPSFYAINALLGLRRDFETALRGVLASQAVLGVCLAALGPVTAVIYLSILRYPSAVFFNGVQFTLATIFSQFMLARHYKPLIAANRRHGIGKSAWLVLYVFVAIQMAWVLRPFIGAPGLTTRFFREEAWSNAYVRVVETIGRTLNFY